jgi:TolA-binding protein
MKAQRPGSKIAAYILLCCIFCPVFRVQAAGQPEALTALTKRVIEAQSAEALYAPLEELKDLYFKDDKYGEFMEFLRSLGSKKDIVKPFIDYYAALARYRELEYFEKAQNWEEYFSKGDAYRAEIRSGIATVMNNTKPCDALHLNARLLAWEVEKEEQDNLKGDTLLGLMNSVREYSGCAGDIAPIKNIADRLMAEGQKSEARQLYKIYIDKLSASGISDEELKNMAAGFYKDSEMELAEGAYDAYIQRAEKTLKKEELAGVLSGIALQFVYKEGGLSDPDYAERIFKKIDSLAGSGAFDEALLYARAFNLEKIKAFKEAKDLYQELLKAYPATAWKDRIDFKLGIIYAYVLRDLKGARSYFEELSARQESNPQVISALYQLGLLSQWENDPAKAREYYNKLIEKAAGGFGDTAGLAAQRLKGLDESRPMEYNLRLFLDLSFREENVSYDATRSQLQAHPFTGTSQEKVYIAAQPYASADGCLRVETQYLWSGHLGGARPLPEEDKFGTQFAFPGTKEVNLVVVTPSGAVDRSLEFVDID